MLLKFLKNIIAPKRCPACKTFIKNDECVCGSCSEIIKNQEIKNLDKKIEFCDGVYSSYYYNDNIRDMVLFAKYKTPEYFLDYFIKEISLHIIEIVKENNIDFITSSPYHVSKLYKYEYDLPQEIVNRLNKELNLPVINTIEKTKQTQKQQDLTDEERKINLINVFSVTKDINGRNILIIDDIITTGNTISQLSLTLKEAGASKVMAYSFAIRKE